MVGAKGAHKIFILPGPNVKLGIAINVNHRFHHDRRHLHPHPHVNGRVDRGNAVLFYHFSRPIAGGAPGSKNYFSRENFFSAIRLRPQTPPVFNNQITHGAAGDNFHPRLAQIIGKSFDELGGVFTAQMTLFYLLEFNPRRHGTRHQFFGFAVINPVQFRRRAEFQKCFVNLINDSVRFFFVMSKIV